MTGEADRERVVGVFDRAAATYDRVGPRSFSHFGQRLADLAQLAPGMNVLDVATGRGAVLFPAVKYVGSRGRVVGIDLSAEMVRATTAEILRFGWSHVAMRRMDAEHLEFPDAAFDRVLCGFALWFFPDPHAVLREFLRVLRPGGMLGLTTWPNDSPAQVFSRALLRPYSAGAGMGAAKPGAGRFDTPDQIQTALEQAGFVDVRTAAEEQDFLYGDGGEWWATLWSMGVRATLEKLAPATLERARTDGIKQLEAFRDPDGFRLVHKALFGFGTKSG